MTTLYSSIMWLALSLDTRAASPVVVVSSVELRQCMVVDASGVILVPSSVLSLELRRQAAARLLRFARNSLRKNMGTRKSRSGLSQTCGPCTDACMLLLLSLLTLPSAAARSLPLSCMLGAHAFSLRVRWKPGSMLKPCEANMILEQTMLLRL